jgi:alpha-tubulin suppressor-like RCC1 family protein
VNIKDEQTYSLANISVIEFPFQQKDRITYIACGGGHIFAKSSIDEIYGWGRNDEGQLGIGFLQEKILSPALIKGLSFKGVIQLSCGDNYTGACTMYGELLVAGALEGGKLGLGKGQRKGYQLDFTRVPGLPEIDYISCG